MDNVITENYSLYCGDCLEVMKQIPDNSIDCVVCDLPYGMIEGMTVLDNCMGSASTGIACLNTNRKFIGIEKDKTYFDVAKKRMESHQTPNIGE